MSIGAPSTPQDNRLACHACGQVHKGSRVVKVADGREMGSYSEEYRLYCEAAWLLRKKRSKRTRIEYLDAVAEKRGVQARVDLREEMLRQWQSRQK